MTKRTYIVDRSPDGGIRCATAEVPPDVTITAPTSNGLTGGLLSTGLQTIVNNACNADGAACGSATASGSKTVTSIQYELRRQNLFGTQCWTGTNAYSFSGCGWRDATWTSGAGSRHWTVPVSSGSAYSTAGTYRLQVRATDSAGEIRTVVFNFTVSLSL